MLAPNIEPKWSQKGVKVNLAFQNALEIQPRFVVLGRFWTPFGSLFGAFWASWEPFGFPQAVFSTTCEVFRSAENLPRFRRESAEIQSRTRRMNPKQS